MAFCSAIFAGLTSILAKMGICHTDADVATAIRTVIVLAFSWIMVFLVGSQDELFSLSPKTWIFLVLSGLSTGASWLFYFKALQIGDVNKVVPIDKSSIVLTIVLAIILLHERVTILKVACIAAIGAGTLLMITKKATAAKSYGKSYGSMWFVYALLSAIFASLTSILGKVGIEGVDSNLGTAIRTGVVLVMAWVLVAVKGQLKQLGKISKKEMTFICLSGIATGASWLCFYSALQGGPASVVVPIDKLSIAVTVLFSYFVFDERLTVKSLTGLLLIIAGTLAMIF